LEQALTSRIPALFRDCLRTILLRVGLVGCVAGSQVCRAQAIGVGPKTLRPHPQLLCVLCSISVTATPAAVTFALVNKGTANASAPIIVTTVIYGINGFASLNLYGFFASATAALTDGRAIPSTIPSSAILGQVPTGTPTSFTAFTQSTALGTAGASLLLYSTTSLASTGCPLLATCRFDTLNLQIDLSTIPVLPAGTFNGTLILQAQAL
jgi:hypothetical protein